MPSDAPAAENPDAELIALLAQFDDLERKAYPRLSPAIVLAEEEALDAARVPLVELQEAMLPRICSTRATTLDGFRARARSLILWDNEMPAAIAASDDPAGYWNERMLYALLRDLAGESAA